MNWIVAPQASLGVADCVCVILICLTKCSCHGDNWDTVCGWVWACQYCGKCPPEALPMGIG